MSDAIHDAIQATAPAISGGRAVLTGWTLTAEWMDETGRRWLSQARAAGTTRWAAAGMHHEVLYSWPEETT